MTFGWRNFEYGRTAEEVQLFQLILKTKLNIYTFTISMNPIYDKLQQTQIQPAFSRWMKLTRQEPWKLYFII